jgi:hypothetical protein
MPSFVDKCLINECDDLERSIVKIANFLKVNAPVSDSDVHDAVLLVWRREMKKLEGQIQEAKEEVAKIRSASFAISSHYFCARVSVERELLDLEFDGRVRTASANNSGESISNY